MVHPSDDARRQCPTRGNGPDALICHSIVLATCQRRQREHYHKCHSCMHRNDGSIARVTTLPPERVQKPEPVPVPTSVQREVG